MVSHQAASVSFYFYYLIIPTRRPIHLYPTNLNTFIAEVTFSANPDVGATLGASAHLIPQVSLGISALDGVASASVFLDLDASLGLQGNVSSVENPQPCLSGNADINVGVGAQGSFFGLFDASTGKSLFDKNFPLFQVRAHSLPYTIFSEYLSFLLHDDSNASPGTRIRRIRRVSRARQTPLRPIQLRRLARPMPLRPIPLLRLAPPMPLRPIPPPRLAPPTPLRLIPLRRLVPPMPLRPIPLLRLARPMPLRPIPLLRLAGRMPLQPIPLRRLVAGRMPLRPIQILRLTRRTPLRRSIPSVTTMLPEQYDTVHDLDDLILLLLPSAT
jgi:hypothetical protein